jgi:hypothetical protein
MERDENIVRALADALAKRLYEAHCEWVLNVFNSGRPGILFCDWYEMTPHHKLPYVELATTMLHKDHLAELTKRLDLS